MHTLITQVTLDRNLGRSNFVEIAMRNIQFGDICHCDEALKLG